MYTAGYIFTVLPIKYLINKDGNPTKKYKLVTGMKPSIYNLRGLFCPCFVWEYTAHLGTKALNMRHQAQKGFRGIFVGMPQHQKGCLFYVPHKQKIVSSYDMFFMRTSLVHWRTYNNHIQNICLLHCLCHAYLMLHLQGNKLAI